MKILNGASNFSTYLLQTATPLGTWADQNAEFKVADANGDGKPDVYAIAHNGTPGVDPRTEVHVLNGASNFTSFLSQTATPLGTWADQNIEFEVADANWDGKPDVYAIAHNGTPVGKTDVHVLNGASNFNTFVSQTGTPLGTWADQNVEFELTRR